MCYPCTHCNKCGAFPTEFMCPRCKAVQERGAQFCTECGAPLPKLPGMPNKGAGKADRVADGNNSAFACTADAADAAGGVERTTNKEKQ